MNSILGKKVAEFAVICIGWGASDYVTWINILNRVWKALIFKFFGNFIF
jgi:hypothetical protein